MIYSNHWSDIASAAKLTADGGTTSWVTNNWGSWKSFNVILSPHPIRVSKEFSAPRHQQPSINPAGPCTAISDHRRTSARLTGSRGGQPPLAQRNFLGRWGRAVKHVFHHDSCWDMQKNKEGVAKSSLFTVLIKLLIKGTYKASKLCMKVSYLFLQSLCCFAAAIN